MFHLPSLIKVLLPTDQHVIQKKKIPFYRLFFQVTLGTNYCRFDSPRKQMLRRRSSHRSLLSCTIGNNTPIGLEGKRIMQREKLKCDAIIERSQLMLFQALELRWSFTVESRWGSGPSYNLSFIESQLTWGGGSLERGGSLHARASSRKTLQLVP